MSNTPNAADLVRLSYRAPEMGTDPDDDRDWVLQDSTWIRDSLDEPSYLRYLRIVHAGSVSFGDEWEEFVSCGCASPTDVVLRVEAVEGGDAIGPSTELRFVPYREIIEAGPLTVQG